MHKKTITILISLLFITTALTTQTTAITTPQPTIPQEIETTYENTTQITSTGPVTPWLNVDQIVIIGGPYFKTFLIRLLLVSLKAYFLIPNIQIPIEDTTFAIRYYYNIPQNPTLDGYQYNTTITHNNTNTSYTTRHIVLVTGFTGTFDFQRSNLLNLQPARFTFTGTCDGVLIEQ